MDEKIRAFEELYESPKVKEILEIGDKIKKLDKSREKRTLGIILLSVISMTFFHVKIGRSTLKFISGEGNGNPLQYS